VSSRFLLNSDEVDKILEKKFLGYHSRAEFVAEAVTPWNAEN
jgi:hypothetical protein